jgi:hypothetical protein
VFSDATRETILQENTLEFTAEIASLTASLTSDSAVVGSETDASIDITSDLSFNEDDVVTITSNLITEAIDFEFTK